MEVFYPFIAKLAITHYKQKIILKLQNLEQIRKYLKDYLIFRKFFKRLIMESDSKKGNANPLCVHYPLCQKEKKCSGCAILNASVGCVMIIHA